MSSLTSQLSRFEGNVAQGCCASLITGPASGHEESDCAAIDIAHHMQLGIHDAGGFPHLPPQRNDAHRASEINAQAYQFARPSASIKAVIGQTPFSA